MPNAVRLRHQARANLIFVVFLGGVAVKVWTARWPEGGFTGRPFIYP